ncbi:MAG: AgmX/PglI C-terminal domain-containing protein [candidate division KSB1 bacterium]|nr:AgmX/PglI C-terminal domain-containing protein [candidate division KSB1 bacterium]
MEHWFDTSKLQQATSSLAAPEPADILGHTPDTPNRRETQKLTASSPQEGGPSPRVVSPLAESLISRQALPSFPKEFNKNYVESLDRRYLIILLLTLLLEPLVIWYLLRTHPLEMSEQEIAKLQSKYADLFLSEFNVENVAGEAPRDYALLRQTAERIPEIVSETVTAETQARVPAIRPETVNPETQTMPGEHRESLRKLKALSRQLSMRTLSREVERIGLLGVITSGSGVVSYEPVNDILEFADSTAWDIDRALAEVKTLRVPRPGVDYFGPTVHAGATRNSGKVFIAPKEVRGKRNTSSGVTAEEIVTQLAEASQKMVSPHRIFERVAPTPSPFGLRSRPTNGSVTRDPEKIREQVLAHNPAIQDCYRYQLKNNPTLKGKITVRFTINPSGHVINAQVYSSSFTSDSMPIELPEMEDCILNKVRKWRDFGQVEETIGEITLRQTYVFGY